MDFMNTGVQDVDYVYEKLVDILINSADRTIPKCKYNPHTKPYWNSDVKQAHDYERLMREKWVQDGRPRGMGFETYKNYKRAKYKFRSIQQAAFEEYIQKTYDDLNEASECDIRLFWKLVKKFKPQTSRIYPKIIYNDTVCSTPQSVADAFADFYHTIYKHSEHPSFMEDVKDDIESTFEDILNSVNKKDIIGGEITEQELNDISKLLKKRKAGGHDKLSNEHLLYGGQIVVKCLTRLFNLIVNIGRTPKSWKRGLTVPLYKGNNKPKSSPDSYRPVCVLPCIFKVFEHVLKSRLLLHVLDPIRFPNRQQQGFQMHLGCVNASFNLYETVYHLTEQCSRIPML